MTTPSGPARLEKLLQHGLDSDAYAPALCAADGAWSWAELEEKSDRTARAYLAMGLEPGDRLASLMPNRRALVVHYLACFKAGIVATPLNYRYMPPEIDHALQVSGARAIVAHAERVEDVAASAARGLPLGVVWDADAGDGSRNLESFMDDPAHGPALPAASPGDPAVIFFTSGSTGPAKGVTHSRESFGWMISQAAEAHGMTSRDTLLPASSFSHVAGIAFTLAGFSVGAPVGVTETFDHAGVGPLLRSVRPTFLLMLPSALLHLLREPETSSADFESIRLMICGGDKVTEPLEREFEALTGRGINECYGMTEIGFAMLNKASQPDKRGSVGAANPGFAFSIRDTDRDELPPGTPGRMWAQTRSLLREYWGDPAATQEVFQGGWFDTGDVMARDTDGYFWFHGRRKQIIVHDGSNIAPQEVEAALLEHPSVANAGVVGVRDELHGENVRAYVEPKPGLAPPSVAELIAFARERVGYKAPEEIVFLEEMPMNATGKVDRTQLKKLAAADHAHCA